MHGGIEVCFLLALNPVVRWSVKVTFTLSRFYLGEKKLFQCPPDRRIGGSQRAIR